MSGLTNDVFMNLHYTLGNKGYIFGGIGYDDNIAASVAESYKGLKAKLGFSVRLPLEFNLGILGEYYNRNYDQASGESSSFNRKDNEYRGSVSLSHRLFYDWLRTVTEFNYIKNRSNIETFEYDRQIITQSIVAEY